MDPQWNVFQPPISEPAILDYNHRSLNSHPTNSHHSQSNNTHYNGYYNSTSTPNTMPPSQPSNQFTTRSTQPPSPCYTNTSSQMYNPTTPPVPPTPTQPAPRSPQMSQSNYFSSNSSSSSSSQYNPPMPDFSIGTFSLNANGYPNESNSSESNNTYTTSSNNDSYSQSNGTYSQNGNSYSQSNGSSYNNTQNNSTTSSSSNNASNSASTTAANNAASQSVRETGIIEKLLQTYGFIQCCERQARLFFHFSQFDGNTEHLRIGDPVEFEVTFDRRTGKPIASTVAKISPEVVLGEERVIGAVTTELRSESSGGEHQGRITYENRGECFFLPYCKEDVEGYVTLKPGDKVSFQIATNQRTGNLAARHVRRENPSKPVKYQGVVSTIKDSYGFIERADVVDEIFFHFSEAKNIPGGLKLGDDVEFLIQSRNAKEVATNIEKLDYGTVVFEDTSTDLVRGQVLKSVERNSRHNQKEPLPGRIRYRGKDRSEVEIKFGERDQTGEFTLKHGDWVQFNIATDRRDHLQKATNISLLDDSFKVSGEKREQGIIISLKEAYGFIKCADRDARMFFHFNEMLQPGQEIVPNEEVEFTVVQDQTAMSPNRQSGIRIHRLPPGTVQFEVSFEQGLEGQIILPATGEPRPSGSTPGYSMATSDKGFEPGNISYTSNTTSVKGNINYFAGDSEHVFQIGDKVKFNVYQIKRTKELVAMDLNEIPSSQIKPTINGMIDSTTSQFSAAVNIYDSTSTVVNSNVDFVNNSPNNPTNNGTSVSPPTNNKTTRNNDKQGSVSSNYSNSNGRSQQPPVMHQGYVAALKETFGFIETIQHDKEIFFHFSNVDGDAVLFELGNEVEYSLSTRTGPGGKVSAENVRTLPVGTLPTNKILPDVFEGTVIRSIRSINPDRPQYCGLLCVGTEDENLAKHEFGITGLVNKRELIQSGDLVTFQLDDRKWAVNIKAIRKKLIATVEAVKGEGQYGFLNYETEEGKKLFFHNSEVKDGMTLNQGDEVEFVIITNQKTGKSSACNIARLTSNVAVKKNQKPRPEHLVHKFRGVGDSAPSRMPVLRQPKGPDGTKGFTRPRFTNSVPIAPSITA